MSRRFPGFAKRLLGRAPHSMSAKVQLMRIIAALLLLPLAACAAREGRPADTAAAAPKASIV